MPQTAEQIAAWANGQTQDAHFRTLRRQLARGGRPSSITEDIIDRLGDSIAETAEYIEDACQAHGIPRRNYYNWLSQGERDANEGLDTPQSRFWHTLKTAEAQGLLQLGKKWIENPRDFAAFATRQERRAPDRWGKRADDTQAPRVVVNIGVGGGDVRVGVALSPGNINDLACGNPSQVEILSPIIGDSVNQRGDVPALVSRPATAEPVRQIPAVESGGGPQPGEAEAQFPVGSGSRQRPVGRRGRKKASHE